MISEIETGTVALTTRIGISTKRKLEEENVLYRTRLSIDFL